MFAQKLIFAALLTSSLAACAQYGATPTQTRASDAGNILTDASGMTLYKFAKDQPGTSNCYDACAAKWPPFLATAEDHTSGEYSIIKRKDGTLQWAYQNAPLYTWFKDSKPGDMTGNGMGGVWYVVNPVAKTSSQSSSGYYGSSNDQGSSSYQSSSSGSDY